MADVRDENSHCSLAVLEGHGYNAKWEKLGNTSTESNPNCTFNVNRIPNLTIGTIFV